MEARPPPFDDVTSSQAAHSTDLGGDVAATVYNAPARCLFLCYFLLGKQKKVDPNYKKVR